MSYNTHYCFLPHRGGRRRRRSPSPRWCSLLCGAGEAIAPAPKRRRKTRKKKSLVGWFWCRPENTDEYVANRSCPSPGWYLSCRLHAALPLSWLARWLSEIFANVGVDYYWFVLISCCSSFSCCSCCKHHISKYCSEEKRCLESADLLDTTIIQCTYPKTPPNNRYNAGSITTPLRF